MENTGSRVGDAVPQLYVRDLFSSVVKPERQLAAFTRVTLAPGERRRLTLTVSPRQLRTLGADYVWRVEPGQFELQLGDNAENILLRAAVEPMVFGSAFAKKKTRITTCTLGYRAGVIGAALLAKER